MCSSTVTGLTMSQGQFLISAFVAKVRPNPHFYVHNLNESIPVSDGQCPALRPESAS